MKLYELVLKNRSYRKYHANHKIPSEVLESLVDLARITPSSKNRQPLKYILVNEQEDTDFVFEQLKWGYHLKNWEGPTADERPPAYIIMLLDTKLNENAMIDAGIAAQTILLGTVENGLGGCIVRTVNRTEIIKYFGIPEHIEVIQVISIGKPHQEVKLAGLKADGDTKYFEDKEGIHWVPKRSLEEIIYKRDKK